MRAFLLTLTIISALMLPMTAGASSAPATDAVVAPAAAIEVPAVVEDSLPENTTTAAIVRTLYLPEIMVSGNTSNANKGGNSGSGNSGATVPATPTPAANKPSTTVPATPTPAPASSTQPSPTPTTPAQSAAGIAGELSFGFYRPDYPMNLSSVSTYEQAAGKKASIIHWFALWGGWKAAFEKADLEAISSRGSMPMISWEPWSGAGNDPNWTLKGAILSGKNDAYIESWAKGMAAYGKPVMLRFAHEMHNQSYPWALGVNGNTAAEYVAAWKHVRAIFVKNGAKNVQWIWNPNTLGDAPVSAYQSLYASLYPGDAEVDWIGLDVYNTGPNVNWGAPYWRSMKDVLKNPYAAITAISSKPLILPEVGSAETGGDKAAWISEAMSASLSAAYPQLKAIIWFDIAKEEQWLVQSSPASYNAFVAGWKSNRFFNGTAGL